MASFRIICTNQEPVGQPHTHAHIVAVGTGTTPDHYDRKWTLADVLAAIDQGHTFYTKGKVSEKVASVAKFPCSACGRTTIRSGPDAVSDNNLDSLSRCA
jgi:hypothetical protein